MFWDKWFKKTEYVIVPLNRGTLVKWDKETKESVASLAYHPGFKALADRAEGHAALLEGRLRTPGIKDIREVDFLTSGIYWLNWLRLEVNKATQIGSLPVRTAEQEELAAWKALDAQIERVGGK